MENIRYRRWSGDQNGFLDQSWTSPFHDAVHGSCNLAMNERSIEVNCADEGGASCWKSLR